MESDAGPHLPQHPLAAVVGEVEAHLAEAGWDQPPQLFALVETDQLLRDEPQLAQTLGLVAGIPGSLTPVAQEPLDDAPLDEQLHGMVFGTEVLGVVLAHEVLVLPPAAEAGLAEEADPAAYAAAHPDRREVRMVAGVLRDGTRACLLRLRAAGSAPEEVVHGPDLTPGLSAALLATLDVDASPSSPPPPS
ncbi:MAG TPA: PPA1309 family protein [Mycobacteriales bacterium]|nr:PPA1309 family protein [Mycobacteriales bacterium]